jgi:hypothetical protein
VAGLRKIIQGGMPAAAPAAPIAGGAPPAAGTGGVGGAAA